MNGFASRMNGPYLVAPDSLKAVATVVPLLKKLTPASEDEEKPLRYNLRSADELLDSAPMAWAVKGVLPERGLALVYGAPGTGKSFLLLDLVCSIAEGAPWFGHKTAQAPVIYLCLEGAAGFVGRVKAWQAAKGRDFPSLVRVVAQSFDLHAAADVKELMRSIEAFLKTVSQDLGPPVIVVDTLNRAMPGADENGAADMGLSLEASSLLSERTGGLVLLAHHSGKDSDRGPRGHSSLLGAVDVSMLVTRSGEQRQWEAKKVKDGVDGALERFELETVVLGLDSDGEELTSCVVRAGVGTPAQRHGPELSVSLKRALRSLCVALGPHPAGESPNSSVFANEQEWRERFYGFYTTASASGKRNAFNRARTDLLEMGCVAITDKGVEVLAKGLEVMQCNVQEPQ